MLYIFETYIAQLLFAFVGITGLMFIFQPAYIAWKDKNRDHNDTTTKSLPKYKYKTRKVENQNKVKSDENVEHPFTTIDEDPTVEMSLIVPAYNEEERLPIMLDETLSFLKEYTKMKKNKGFTYEIIIVDDGSKDQTCSVVEKYMEQEGSDTLRLLKLSKNSGKGAAIRSGMLHSRGRYLLMVDADGATDIRALDTVYKSLRDVEKNFDLKLDGKAIMPTTTQKEANEITKPVSLGMVVGSRAHLEENSLAERAWYRTLLMQGLHFLVALLISKKLRDTQCGFKIFTRDTARFLFRSLHLTRWAFDLELVRICDIVGIPMGEEAVAWKEIDGSKLIQNKFDIIKASVLMLRDMVCVRLCYMLGIWKFYSMEEIPNKKKQY